MSETAAPEVDHRELTAWVAITSAHSNDRHLHRVAGDPGPDELVPGEDVDVACETSLTGENTRWRAKPAAAFPVGYYELCTDPECFGAHE